MARTMWIAIGAATMLAGTPALAADNPMKVCAARYQDAKAKHTLPAGQTWMAYLASCRKTLPAATAATATASTSVHSVATTTTTTRPAGQPSPAQLAERTRQKQCGAQWKADKAAGKILAGQTWPKYWSACSARLKG